MGDYADNPRSYGSLATARTLLERHPAARKRIIASLVEIERELRSETDINIREDLTGPLVDALFDPGEELMLRTVDGMTFSFRYTSKIARDLVMAGDAPDHVWEPQTTRAATVLARGARNVIVGGAYFGDHALFIARVLGPDGICHCFEPAPESRRLLAANLEANGIANVALNAEALWSQDGVRIALVGADSHASPRPAEPGYDAPAFVSRSIDRYAEIEGLAGVDLIILDIEGGELAAIDGAARVLGCDAASAPAVICEIHSRYCDWSDGLRHTALCRRLTGHGYEVFAIRDYQGNERRMRPVVELVDIDSAVLEGPPHGFNLLAVKTRERLDAGVFRIVHGVSPKLLHHRDPRIHAPLEPAAARSEA
jgi:FkbM family methyltransferase